MPTDGDKGTGGTGGASVESEDSLEDYYDYDDDESYGEESGSEGSRDEKGARRRRRRKKSCLCKRVCRSIDLKSEELMTKERIVKELETRIVHEDEGSWLEKSQQAPKSSSGESQAKGQNGKKSR